MGIIKAIRGATTVAENQKTEIFEATIELVQQIMERNGIEPEDMIDIIFTVTPDLTAAFPAAAVRQMGICDVPLLDMAAPAVDGALKQCIRVLVHIHTEDCIQSSLCHVYLREAAVLRPDLIKKGEMG